MAQNLPVFALLLLCTTKQVSAGLVSANVGENVTLTAGSDCRNAGSFRLVTGDNTRTVARRLHGEWQPVEGYQGRIRHHSATSVLLLRVNYNDEGYFEFFCGEEAHRPIELRVLIPSKIAAIEGDTVELPCHVLGRGGPAGPLRWERNGKPVFEHDPSSQMTRPGAGFEDRVSITPDGSLRGDLSLTLKEVRLQDEGVFFCYVIDKEGTRTRGNPAAARLDVIQCNPDQTAPPTPSTPGSMDGMGPGAVAGLVLACAGCSFLLGWFLRPLYRRPVNERATGL